ncbi:site-2 protease family protein [Planctomicrobium sp. SH668]|uniref:site-2 protease family protein n=1 Tax=Planctomicrobium sp. SH668 TaxID=3448126 RepID=UPI003F5C1ED4
MLGPVQPTNFDAQFSIARIPVRISIWFWVGATVLGFGLLEMGVEYLIAWWLVVLVSILIHELGHALVARAFGYRPRILLYQFGGLAMYEPYGNYTPQKSIAISLAGPGAGFLFFGVLWLLNRFALPYLPIMPENFEMMLSFVLLRLFYINLWWGLVNLLPVFPLDGGQVCLALCSMKGRDKGRKIALWISIVTAAIAGTYFLMQGRTFAVMLFFVLGFNSYQSLQDGESRDSF